MHPSENQPAAETPVEDPFNALLMGAVAMHEHYKAFVQAGFTKAQSFLLIRDMLHDFRGTHRD